MLYRKTLISNGMCRWDILCNESKRLYQFWIGLPVQPRRWRFELPDLNREL